MRISGSSPQVRGRSLNPLALAILIGLIPAGAGQIPRAPALRAPRPAHPRRCGADCRDSFTRELSWGSSPQVRGRSPPTKQSASTVRLIPAGAGQMAAADPLVTTVGAHPRRCGADNALVFLGGELNGSSPQVRGRYRRWTSNDAARGLIPAGAGQMENLFSFSSGFGAHPRRCGADPENEGA